MDLDDEQLDDVDQTKQTDREADPPALPSKRLDSSLGASLNAIMDRYAKLKDSIGASLNDERVADAFNATTKERTQNLIAVKRQEAERLVEDPEKVASLIASLKDWAERFALKLKPGSFEGFTTVFRMLSSTLSGEYQGFSKSALACLVGAALYCVSPIDAIPDALPVIGLVDDAFVLAWTLKTIASETLTYRTWERLKASKAVLASYLPYFNDVKHVVLCPGWMTENETHDDVVELLAPVFPNATFERFAWRSNVSWNEARNYVDASGGDELLSFVNHISSDLSSVAVVGHSLGARATVRALAKLSLEPQRKAFWSRKPVNRVAQAFLLGAAVDADDPDLPLAASGVSAPLCNFFNRSDRVLNYLYRVAEQKTALGLAGIGNSCDNYVDCVVSGREEYWLNVAENVASVLSLLQSRSFLTGLAVGEDISNDLTSYWRHQFKLYATFFKDSVVVKDELGSNAN